MHRRAFIYLYQDIHRSSHRTLRSPQSTGRYVAMQKEVQGPGPRLHLRSPQSHASIASRWRIGPFAYEKSLILPPGSL